MNEATDLQRTLATGSMIGLIGGGQLGMFFIRSAQRMGYRVCCFCQSSQEPAVSFADETVIAPFEDASAISRFVKMCDVVTYEFESIPPSTLQVIDDACILRPSLDIIQTAQDRAKEKLFLQSIDIPVAPFAIVKSRFDLERGMRELEGDTILKTATDGYDGKGQWSFTHDSDLESVWAAARGRPCVLEKRIDLDYECSVIIAGDVREGQTIIGPIRNYHRDHILDLSFPQSEIDPKIADTAIEYAKKIASYFDLVGTICVEYFVTTDGEVLVNEIAPRPHNSGHLTIDAFDVSQFDLQACAVAGLPVPSSTQKEPAAMVNLLGDLWADGEPDFEMARQSIQRSGSRVHVHLYGKPEPRPGRKMGHVTVVGDDQQQTIADARIFRSQLEASRVRIGDAVHRSLKDADEPRH